MIDIIDRQIATTASASRSYDTQLRKYTRAEWYANQSSPTLMRHLDQLWQRLKPWLPATIEHEGQRWHLCGLNSYLRCNRYATGDFFQAHRDVPTQLPGKDDTRTFLTLNIFLNTVATSCGGATRFYEDSKSTTWSAKHEPRVAASIQPRAGRVVVFSHTMLHDGSTVHSGVKYIMRTDCVYTTKTESKPSPLLAISNA